ncbi:Lipoate--protein ligase [Ascochyta rabiei]|uniref:Putative lipoate-protein ligase A n=1 Tax=Didymella rabiei TaxID=5454 RepID=A0A163H168_DIDRA|nr:Lipoate--protein ligase [Ascochyta rabiei]KZM25106.1 cellular protein modification process [Ascochyta rabiei]UPX16881.1 Lipoate--protein ligase [Ascochyta rabiei]
MAPSRGLQLLSGPKSFHKYRSTSHCALQTAAAITLRWPVNARRTYSSFTENLSNPANKLQSYVSRSSDPYLNLSIEDHILRKSPPDSTILFLYVNRPCVVIGRNQNPWTEVNLSILNAATGTEHLEETEPPGIGAVDIVRRRSGGGTVFHDEGNLNWSITCPRNEFTRDKHAEMVVRALRKLGIDRARVNERHDIVLDQGHEKRPSDPEDTHRTPYTIEGGIPKPLKVSGSAYKLTRQRALHHATTLLESPNLHIISQYLRSPAKRNIEAKGVESVSSPVSNIGLDLRAYQQRLQEVFAAMYANIGKINIVETVGDEYLNIPDIKKGYDELRTQDWMWAQTPQFDAKLDFVDGPGVTMNVHHGVIKTFDVEAEAMDETHEDIRSVLVGKKLQDVTDWTMLLQSSVEPFNDRCAAVAKRLEELLPIPKFPRS